MTEIYSRHSEPLIDVRGLSHIYPNGFVALQDVSLQISEGEFVAFIGQNGSGKTTLAKHFVGLLRATKGQVFVAGEDVAKKPIVELARMVAYVFQNADDQIFSSTVSDEVSYGPKNLGVKEGLSSIVDEALGALGIVHLKNKHPMSLSWGDRQKVAIASVLAIGPEIVILDEPTTGQDMRGGHEILQTCKRLNEQGKTIIVITHNMELVAEYCRTVYLLYKGEILAEGPVDEVFIDVETLRKSFITPPQISRLAKLISDTVPDFPSSILSIDQMVRELSRRVRVPHE